MRTKKTASMFLPGWLLLAPVFTFAQLNDAEQAFAQRCRDNVNIEKRQLSSDTALECVQKLTDNNGALLAGLRAQSPEMEAAAADILSFNSALIDLKNIVTRNSGDDIALHLTRVLKDRDCPLCVMGLGPRPEKAFDWIGREAGADLDNVKIAVRTWEALGELRTRSLSSAEYKFDQKRWNAKTITGRHRSLLNWARKETDRLAALYAGRSRRPGMMISRSVHQRLVPVLREDLIAEDKGDDNAEYLAKLDRLEMRISGRGDGTETSAPPPADKKAEELDAAAKNVEELKEKPAAEQAAYLSGLFDQAASNNGGVSEAGPGTAEARPADFVFNRLSAKTRDGLSRLLVSADADGNLRGPFADELRGTKAGDEILAFYKDPEYAKTGVNRLSFIFTRQPKNRFGGWTTSSKMMDLNSLLINNWMKMNKVRPEQFFEGDPSNNPYLRKLARYLAPTFVHEATHQRQDARTAVAGILDMAPYQMEMETEAFAMDTSFMSEQLQKRGVSYAADLCPFDKMNAAAFIENGVEGVRLFKHMDYGYLESLEGSVAKEFVDASSTVKELEPLEAEDPGIMEEAELKQMRDLRMETDSQFKWYTMVRADSAAFEVKINGWRKELIGKVHPSRSTGEKAPPELL